MKKFVRYNQVITDNAQQTTAAATPVQCKLTVGAVNDPLEQEADAMADRVLRMPSAEMPVKNQAAAAAGIQRKCAACEEEEQVQRKPLSSFIRRKSESAGTVAGEAVSSRINNTRGGGDSMDGGTRSFMESRFGTDFSGVRIHTGDYAVQMSRELNAKAFTVGSDIYFNSNQYDPQTDNGRHLLAHELTHTVQQTGPGTIQRAPLQFNADVIAHQLNEAMDRWGTDEDAIYSALAGRTQAEVDAIAAAYLQLTGRTLQADLESELTEGELKYLATVSTPFTQTNAASQAEVIARQIFQAVDGPGTNEEAIYAALAGRTSSMIADIAGAYKTVSDGNDMMADLRGDLNDSEFARLQALLGVSPGCTDAETQTIQTAIYTANAWVSSALAKLTSSPPSAQVLTALKNNFGSAHGVAANIPTFISRIREANYEMSTVSITCAGTEDATCAATAPCGYTPYAGAHSYVICRNATLQSGSDPIYQAGCVLHEAFHSAFSDFSVDSYSGWQGHAGGTAGYPGSDAMINADSYASLVLDLS